MCLAVPMKIVALEKSDAVVEQAGTRRRVRADLLDGLALGDYVLVHAGIAIARVDPEEAERTLALLSSLDEIP
jgi:hydrogenase expression/formation protein HypC